MILLVKTDFFSCFCLFESFNYFNLRSATEGRVGSRSYEARRPPPVWQRAGGSGKFFLSQEHIASSSFQYQRRWDDGSKVISASIQLSDASTTAHAPEPLAFREQRFTLICSYPADAACDQPVASLADN